MDDHRTRLTAMEGWYEQLIALDQREQLLLHDYAPHQTFCPGCRVGSSTSAAERA
jgi:hypothetical protein